MQAFRDRRHGASGSPPRLALYRGESPVVVGLPRGGVVVAAAVAEASARAARRDRRPQVGVPSQPELGMGAVGEGGVIVRTEPVIQALRG